KTSPTPPSNMSTGSTIAGFTPSSAWPRRPSSRPPTTKGLRQPPWPLPNKPSLYKTRGCSLLEWIGGFTQRAKGNATRQDRGSLLLLSVTLPLGIAAGFIVAVGYPQATITWQRSSVFWLRVALLLAGVALRQYAIRVLGRFF